MAIRYTSELNNEMRRSVKNFNAKVTYMENKNYRNIPERTSVRELKARYSKRSDLIREINRLNSFKKTDLVKRIETDGGNKAIKWQLDFIKANTENAKEYFQNEYKRVSKRLGKFPGERTYLDTISAKIELLERDINYMNQSDFRSTYNIVNEFAMSPTRRKAQYRGYLSEVEWLMNKLGYEDEKIEKLFNKFTTLTPSQFLYAYDNNDIIAKIYRLYHKDYGDAEGHLTTRTEEQARDLVDEFFAQVDDIVKDAKKNMD